MHALLVVGTGAYGGGFSNSSAMNWCCLVLFWTGAVMLWIAFQYLRKAPDIREVALPPSESPRR